jgi:transcriptional regulator with XRE-family HTH domain
MKPDFAHMLSALRRENHLSQKKAADGLGISQALLSHYENGIREPKLEFVLRACDYYCVTSDYILGRTTEKTHEGVALKCTNDSEKRNADAASLIISMLTELGDEQLSEAVSNYMNYSIYAVASALCSKKRQYEPFFDAALKLAEAAFIQNVRRVTIGGEASKRLSDDMLRERFPEQYAAMLEMEEIVKKAVATLKQPSAGD